MLFLIYKNFVSSKKGAFKMRKIISAIFMISAFGNCSAEAWLCITDSGTAYEYEKASKRWSPFVVNDASKVKYILRLRNSSDDKYLKVGAPIPYLSTSTRYVLNKFGDDFPLAGCGEFNKGSVLWCGGMDVRFAYSKKTNRFIISDATITYLDPIEKEGEYAAMRTGLGKCAAL
jgi:hypothetical protein